MVPAIALEVHRIVQQPDLDFERVARLSEQDPMLTAEFLRKVRSPLYASRAPIQSLRDALARLGLKQVADLLLEAAVNMRIFKAKGYEEPMESLRRHSVATAHIARLVSLHTAIATEYAFMCGLLRDLGLAAILVALADGRFATEPPQLELLRSELSDLHAQVSGLVAKVWKLPADLQVVLTVHHTVTVSGQAHPLAAIVCVAEWLATELGAGAQLGEQQPFERFHSDALERAKTALGLGASDLAALRQEAQGVVEHLE